MQQKYPQLYRYTRGILLCNKIPVFVYFPGIWKFYSYATARHLNVGMSDGGWAEQRPKSTYPSIVHFAGSWQTYDLRILRVFKLTTRIETRYFLAKKEARCKVYAVEKIRNTKREIFLARNISPSTFVKNNCANAQN